MQEKDIVSALKSTDSLIQNDYYFKYIFRKTEKIICAVFYILSLLDKKNRDEQIITDIQSQALQTLSFVGTSLASSSERSEEIRQHLMRDFILMESKLRVLHAAGHLSQDHLNVFIAEIDTVTRSVRGMGAQQQPSVSTIDTRRMVRDRQKELRSTSPQTTRTTEGGGQSRRQLRILELLRAEPNASIKDISDQIQDCSQKTIQRELNDMIEKGHVIRSGEKRWSRYSLTA